MIGAAAKASQLSKRNDSQDYEVDHAGEEVTIS
jgi:hypothetical protein